MFQKLRVKVLILYNTLLRLFIKTKDFFYVILYEKTDGNYFKT